MGGRPKFEGQWNSTPSSLLRAGSEGAYGAAVGWKRPASAESGQMWGTVGVGANVGQQSTRPWF